MLQSSLRGRRPPTDAVVADFDSSCGDSGISGASACASPTHQQHQHHQLHQPLLPSSSSSSSGIGGGLEVGGGGGGGYWQHAMAMSVISELPSPTSPTTAVAAAASGAASQPSSSFQASRLTQSMSYGKGASAQSRRQALAHSLAMLSHETRSRQRELDRREREVQAATAKATEQIEYVLKMTEKTHDLEDENSQLRGEVELYKAEVGKLLDELADREADLAERDQYCQALRSELGRSRQDIAQMRTCADQLKVENSVLNESRNRSAAGGAVDEDQKNEEKEEEEKWRRGSCEECEQLRLGYQRLQRQLAQAEAEAASASAEAARLQAAVDKAEAAAAAAAASGGVLDRQEARSKAELFQTIRRLAEDKMAWEAYCARLMRCAVEFAPQLLCRQAASTAAAKAEDRWEILFNRLMQAVMQSDPRLADCVTAEGHSNKDEEEEDERRRRQRQQPPRPPPSRPQRESTLPAATAVSSASSSSYSSALYPLAATAAASRRQSGPTGLRKPRPILQPTLRSTRSMGAATGAAAAAAGGQRLASSAV